MDSDTRYRLVTRNLQEIITPNELKTVLENIDRPKGYVGFETSGLMHAGTGLIVGKKMLDYVEAGFEFIIFLADWHAWINNKLEGVMENIRIGGEYFKDCFTALGLNGKKVTYLWASELVDDKSYWEKVIKVMKNTTMNRILRAMPIMGRSADSIDVEAAWTIYPAMQTSDIFQMNLDCACSGMDQRKVHMLAREVAPKFSFKPPVCLHSPLLPGLQKTSVDGVFDEDESINVSITQKMSKSIERGAIWVNDSPKEIREKYRTAFCPPKIVLGNPVLDHARMVVFPHFGELSIERQSKYGGDLKIHSFEELARIYSSGELHPLDLKNGVADAVVELLNPVRQFFKRKPENYERMKTLTITR